MRLFAVGVEFAHFVAAKRKGVYARKHRVVAPAQHQQLDSRLPFGQGRSTFGRPVMQAAASLSVTRSRPDVESGAGCCRL